MSSILGQNSNISKKLPLVGGDIDWDKIAESYFDYILSPYAPEMIEGYESAQSQNLLLNYIHTMPKDELRNINVLDMGCGLGNLIPYLN